MVVGSDGGPDYSFRSGGNNGDRNLIFDNGTGNTAFLTIVGDGQHVIGSDSGARVNIRLDADTRISNNSTGNIGLTIGQSNHIFDTNGNTATFTGSGTTLVNSVIQGTGGITIDNTGVVRLANANTHSGGTILQKGTLQIANDQALGTGTFNINGGNIQAHGAARSIANTYNINNGYTVSGSNNMTFSGTGTVGAGTHTINVAGVTHTLSGPLGGSGGLIMDGTGTLAFTGDNKTFSGGLTVNGGTVNATRGGNITLGATDATNNIAGSGNITANSGGTFNLTQTANNSITLRGGSTLANNGGTINITSTGNNEARDFFIGTGASDAGHLVSTGGTTNINVGDDVRVRANSSITVSGGTVNLTPADAFYTEGTAGNAANINVSGSGSLNIDITGARSDNNQITIGQHDNLTVTGPNANATFTGQNNSSINLNGKISLSNEGTLTVENGNTSLGASATLNGGTAANKGTLVLNDSNLTLSNATSIANAPNITFNLSDGQNRSLNGAAAETSIENLGTLTVNGADDAVLTLGTNINNVQAQKIAINGGTLMLSSNDQIENNTAMELAGGTWNTAGYSEVLGTLTLSANSYLDLGSGSSVINFADSSSQSWSSDDVMIIQNWSGSQSGGGTDQVVFGNNKQSLSSDQLGKIYFYNPAGLAPGYYAAMMLENGEIVPIPEPSTWLAGGALLGLLLWFERKRLTQWFKRWKK